MPTTAPIQVVTPKILGGLDVTNTAIAENLLYRTAVRNLTGVAPRIIEMPREDITLRLRFSHDSSGVFEDDIRPSTGTLVGFRTELSMSCCELLGIWRPDDVAAYNLSGGHQAYLIRIRFGWLSDDPRQAEVTICWHANERANKALYSDLGYHIFNFPN